MAMAKTKIEFVCQSCGARAPKWMGKCGECGEFNTLVEEVARPEETARRPVLSEERPVPITEVQPVDRPRIVVGIGEFDRVLRSEEHTSELQSQSNLVCRLLLEK